MTDSLLFGQLGSTATQDTIERLGWALIHSLWQFALAALFAGIVVRCLQRSSAAARYAALVASLSIAVALPIATYSWLRATVVEPPVPLAQQNPQQPSEITPRSSGSLLKSPPPSIQTAPTPQELPSIDSAKLESSSEVTTPVAAAAAPVPINPLWWERVRIVIEPWLNWIVATWIAGVLVCSLRPLLGWRMLRQLRVVGTSAAPDDLRALVQQLSQRLGLRCVVEVLQSSFVKVPMVIGSFRPVILLPVSLLTNIPPAQLESIVAHELAHVRRHDFVVNLLQTLVETLFFYHPAIWWLSNRIRIERELCCDDLVVAAIDDRLEYSRALLAIAEFRHQQSVLALGAADGSLLSRVRRIIGLRPQATNAYRERWLVVCSSLICALFALGVSFNLGQAVSQDEIDHGPVIAKLPGHIEVELIGVGFHPSENREWWGPGGGRLKVPPELLEDVHNSVLPNSPEQKDFREFLIKIRGLPSGEYAVSTNYGRGVSSTGGSEDDRGVWTGQHAAGPFKSPTTPIELQLAIEPFGPWVPIDSSAKKQLRLPFSNDISGLHDLIRPVEVRGDDSTTTLLVEKDSFEALHSFASSELFAIDMQGERHRIATQTVPAVGERQLTFKLPHKQLARFEYHLRPYRHRITFENVSLIPGKLTRVVSQVETSAVESPRLNLLKSDGTRTANEVIQTILASRGLRKVAASELLRQTDPQGFISLDRLPAGTNWLVAGSDSSHRTVFPLSIPSQTAVIEQRLKQSSGIPLTAFSVEAVVTGVGLENEAVEIKIQNQSDVPQAFALDDLSLTTMMKSSASYRVLAPRTETLADPKSSAFTIQPREIYSLSWKWNEWVRAGLWLTRVGESVDEMWSGRSEPGKLQARVNVLGHGSFPLFLTLPAELANQNAATSATKTSATETETVEWGAVKNGLRCRVIAAPPDSNDESPEMSHLVDQFPRGRDVTFAVELQNVSDQPQTLLGIRRREGGKPAPDIYTPHLFDFEFTHDDGTPIARAARSFVGMQRALRGASTHEIPPQGSLVMLLRPGRIVAPMDCQLPAGTYRLRLHYLGVDEQTRRDFAEQMPGQPDALAWGSDVASNEIRFQVAGNQITGQEPDLNWGPTVQGLRAAVELRPQPLATAPDEPSGTFPLKAKVATVVQLKNVSQETISFLTEASRQSDEVSLLNSAGESVAFPQGVFSGRPVLIRWTLKPGQSAELRPTTLGIGMIPSAGQYSLRYNLHLNGVTHSASSTPLREDVETVTTGFTNFTLRERTAADEIRESQQTTESGVLGSPAPQHATNGELPRTVIGTIVDANNLPVAGLHVMAFAGGNRLNDEFISDARGQIRVPQHWRESNHYLTLVARDGDERLGWFDFFLQGHSDNGQKNADGSFKLMLVPLNRIVRGKLVDEASRPLPGIVVRVEYLQHEVNFSAVHWRYQQLANEPLIASAKTNERGEYELRLPAASHAWLGIVHEDWVSPRIQAAKNQQQLATIRLVRAAKVVGRVVDERSSQPLPGVRIAAQSDSDHWGDAKSDANGNFIIGGLPEGNYRVMLLENVEKVLTAPAHEGVKLSTQEPFRADFMLNVGRHVTGRVVDAQNNAPVADCTVHCECRNRPGYGISMETNARGEFEFYVSPGRAKLTVADGRLIVEGQSREVDVPVEGDPDPIVLKAGEKLEEGGPVKVFLGPPGDRKVSLQGTDLPLTEALRKLCQSAAVQVDLDADRVTAAGYSSDSPVTVNFDRVPLEEALKQTLAPFEKLAFSFEGNRVFVSTRLRVEAKEKARNEGLDK